MPSIPDPVINCDFKNVYNPSDDTYLILDYFKSNINKSYFDGLKISEIKRILDLGTGTGIIAIFFQIIKNYNPNFNPEIYASDILEDAITCAQLNEKANSPGNEIRFIHSNLFDSFPNILKQSFNIIIFNPPYLPSSELIENKKSIDYSWNGGEQGYELIFKFLKTALTFLNLSEPHYIYYISSSRTDLIELNRKIQKLGYRTSIIKEHHIFFENIYLNRIKYDKR